MSGRTSVTIIAVAIAFVLAVAAWQYLSPYNACVRGMLDSGAPDRSALLNCKGA